jgi:predicted metal-binding protein
LRKEKREKAGRPCYTDDIEAGGTDMEEGRMQTLINLAKEAGAAGAGIAEVAHITFRPEFRAACAQNLCGKYGTCWMCPPDVGEIDDMIASAKKYQYMLVFQTIAPLADSFDIEGMERAAAKHNALTLTLAKKLEGVLEHPLRLGDGACHVCPRCTKTDELPCAYPEEATASLEAYGIAVSELAEQSGLQYINGANTVTYFGGFLF